MINVFLDLFISGDVRSIDFVNPSSVFERLCISYMSLAAPVWSHQKQTFELFARIQPLCELFPLSRVAITCGRHGCRSCCLHDWSAKSSNWLFDRRCGGARRSYVSAMTDPLLHFVTHVRALSLPRQIWFETHETRNNKLTPPPKKKFQKKKTNECGCQDSKTL